MKNISSSISSIKVSRPGALQQKGYIPYASNAVRQCLTESECKQLPLGMLVSTAIFREKHIVEPALASLILGELYNKPLFGNKVPEDRLANVMTFDLNNGACGLIQAIQLVDSYIRSGKIETGIVVAGDSVYQNGAVDNYDFAAGVAAIMLSREVSGNGFSGFSYDTYEDYHDDFYATSYFANQKRRLKIEEKNNFLEHAVECASLSIDKFLETEKITTKEIDIVICSQFPEGFSQEVCSRYGLLDKLIQPKNGKQLFHTASPLFGLHSVFNTPRFKSAKRVLTITAGSGITTSIALYNQLF